jgi:hypothetical protein
VNSLIYRAYQNVELTNTLEKGNYNLIYAGWGEPCQWLDINIGRD